jgi:Tol biopolymer transport system component
VKRQPCFYFFEWTQSNNSSETLLSLDARFVVFDSAATNLVEGDTNNNRDIFVHDRQTGQTARISISSAGEQAAGVSDYPVISPNGRYVAFSSNAANLVSNDTNNDYDVFLHDRDTDEMAS